MPCLLAYVGGLWAALHSPVLLPWPGIALGTGLLLIGVRKPRLNLLSAFLLGVLWASGNAQSMLTESLPDALAGRVITVEGVITGLIDTRNGLKRLHFAPDQPISPMPGRLRLTWYNAPDDLAPGQGWRLFVKLKPPHGSANPGSFDYQRLLLASGIGATGYVRQSPPPSRHPEWDRHFSLDKARHHISQFLDAQLAEYRHAGIIKALLLADRRALDDPQWQVLRRTGTAHLVAISGLHLGLVAGGVFWLARQVLVRFAPMSLTPAIWAAALAILAAGAYAALAGWSLPTQRAWLMVSAVMLAIISRKRVGPARVLVIALALIVTLQPMALTEPGLWLSFAAVSYLYLIFQGRLAAPRRWQAALTTHLALAVALAPLTLSFFQQASLIAPLANVWAVPVFMLVAVPLLMLAGLFSVWPEVAAPLWRGADMLLTEVMHGLTVLAEIPWASLSAPMPSPIALLLAILGSVWLFGPKILPRRWPALALFVPLLSAGRAPLEDGEFRLHVLDVGQGSANVLETRRHVLVFDTGPRFRTGTDMGRLVVTPFLQQRGHRRIDMLIISHNDLDHAGGAPTLLKRWPVGAIYASEPAPWSAQPCQRGQQWHWDGVSLTMLGPPSGQAATWSDNNRSCVLKVSSPLGSVLLTADIEAKAEQALLTDTTQNLSATLLIASHHGSRGASTAAFVQTVQPEWVFISSGYRNAFAFPHPETLRRYADAGARWLNTAEAGALEAQFTRQGISFSCYRQTARRFWYQVPANCGSRERLSRAD
ncbi:MAG: DNA internalization-related competence protein ComEC/Rec2 [Methylococcales bacterium]|nr:DNA internalization-related competence protein ComEC/Rec2 [Methylococcales bacterium]